MTIKIRKAVLDDAEAIVKVHINTWKVSYKGLIPQDVLDNKIVSSTRIEEMKKTIAQNVVWVAEANKNVVAFAGLSEESIDKQAEIAVFYVLPEYQGQGVGRKLFAHLTKDLAKQKYRELVLWTMHDALSVEFYKKMGGVLTGSSKTWKYDKKIVEFVWKF